MSTTYYIGFDVHCAFTEVAVVTSSGRLLKRERCGTTIPELTQVLEAVRSPRHLTFEEGPMAGWLYRELESLVDKLVVCDARRNRLVAKDSDKDDPIDSEKLAQLFRGGYLKPVHQAESLERAIFKQHVGLYHDSVRDRVRMSNTILAQMRRFGVFSSEKEMADADNRPRLLRKLPRSRLLREDIELLWVKYDSQVQQTDIMGDWLERNAQGEPTIQRFVKVPGIRWIRAATFFAYVDTPWRFHKKQDLWKYTGIGLERSHSGCGPTQVHVAQYANRRLRGVLLGAAKTAIRTESNPFYDHYQRWTQKEGISVPNARRNTARSLAATLWGMWKNGSEYRPELVAIGGKTADTLASSQ
jgi:transposase